MNSLTIFEFDKIVASGEGICGATVPLRVFSWLKAQCLSNSDKTTKWARLARLNGQLAVQVTSYVGVLRTPCGFQIEVLPKIGRNTSPDEARSLLIEMLRCLAEFQHIKTASADLTAVRMPLMEVFIHQFLVAVSTVVKHGLRSDYVEKQDNLFSLRGKILVANQITQNLVRRDRFFTEHDEFSPDRAENRLVHSALRHVLSLSRSQENQRIARELSFVFATVPQSGNITLDFQKIRLDRGMGYYKPALDWAKLILQELSPIPGIGKHHASSLLFPMERVFEAYVEKHLSPQLHKGFFLKAQASSQYLVTHEDHRWFQLRPDLLVKNRQGTHLVLDTKWKLLDSTKNNGTDKYQLSQADFYQLYAYGHHYLDGEGEIILIYPETDSFDQPLPAFDFPKPGGMKLWVLPYCLKERRLKLPASELIHNIFVSGTSD